MKTRLEELNKTIDSWDRSKQETIMKACIEGAKKGIELTTSSFQEEIECLIFIEAMEIGLELAIKDGHQ